VSALKLSLVLLLLLLLTIRRCGTAMIRIDQAGGISCAELLAEPSDLLFRVRLVVYRVSIRKAGGGLSYANNIVNISSTVAVVSLSRPTCAGASAGISR
jgi:hypothetical protein